jgi:hypothetical protein
VSTTTRWEERADDIPGQEEDLASGRYVRFGDWLWIVPEVFWHPTRHVTAGLAGSDPAIRRICYGCQDGNRRVLSGAVNVPAAPDAMVDRGISRRFPGNTAGIAT